MKQDIVVIGTQFGDEGKGRVVDLLAFTEDSLVVRYSGGPNAGHTVVVGEQVFKFHNLPSGSASARPSLIGGGCIVDLDRMLKEIAALNEARITPSLAISSRAHVIMPYHPLQDRAEEAWRRGGQEAAGESIGTTGRGIGPCYADKAARTGFRVGDLLLEEGYEESLRRVLAFKRNLLTHCYGAEIRPEEEALDFEALQGRIAAWRVAYGEMIVDELAALARARSEGKRLIFEGAQGFALDLEHGRYPYVSSSLNTLGGAVANGARQPLVIGVNKSYASSVGYGAMPSELFGELSDLIVERGREYGTTTGRRRRVGWLDLPLLRRAIAVSQIDALCITSMDVLGGLDEVGLCIAYEIDGREESLSPVSLEEWDRAKAITLRLDGWPELDGSRIAAMGWEALPKQALDYFETLERELGVPIHMTTFGRERTMFAARGSLNHLSAPK